MPTCTDCGGHVSRTYERVFADRDGDVRCVGCAPGRWADTLAGIHGY